MKGLRTLSRLVAPCTSACLLLIACTSTSTLPTPFPPPEAIHLLPPIGQELTVHVEIADSDTKRMKGLMFREHLAEGTGMLFVFPESRPLSFWMKNTLIPLDILYFDASGIFVSSATMTPCKQDPCASYPSAGPARFALEVPAGFLKDHRIVVGWKIDGPFSPD